MPRTNSKVDSGGMFKLRKYWIEWRAFIIFLPLMLVFRSAIADWNQVPSGSMIPSILEGDRLVVDKIAYDLRVPFTLRRITAWDHPQRGDIVTFPSPADEELYVKRNVALPGDVVELRRNVLVINGEAATYEPVTPAEMNRYESIDPRYHLLRRETILGSSRIVMFMKAVRNQGGANFGPVTVPPGMYFVLGDNRDNSKDSRRIGFIERKRIIGRAHAIAFSVDYENYFAPRIERFFTDLH